MAKDLPYFKFFSSEWNDGDITLESYEVQGVFINVCSYYWSKECDVSKKLIYKRFRNAKEIIDILFEEGLIKINNEHLSISFLDEQFYDIESNSKLKSIAGKKSAKLKKLRKEINQLCKDFSIEFGYDLTKLQQEFNTDSTDVDLLLQHISTIKIRRDKIIKDKDNNTTTKEAEVDFFKVDEWIKEIGKSQMYLEGLYRTHKLYKGSISELLNNFKEHLKIYPKLHNNISDFKKHFASWLNVKISKGEMSKYLKNTKGQL